MRKCCLAVLGKVKISKDFVPVGLSSKIKVPCVKTVCDRKSDVNLCVSWIQSVLGQCVRVFHKVTEIGNNGNIDITGLT